MPQQWTPENEDDEDAYWAAKRKQGLESPHTLERWFRARVWAWLTKPPGHRVGRWRLKSLAALDWFWEHRSDFLKWESFDSFQGEGYAAGRWTIDMNAISEAQGFAWRAGDIGSQVEYFLMALSKGWLPPPPEEPRGVTLDRPPEGMTRKEMAARERRLERLRDRWPRACDKCRAVFVPTQRNRARDVTTCNTCKGGGKK